jgi:TRAP-type C4-dicarboxylate transport system permease small subunit
MKYIVKITTGLSMTAIIALMAIIVSDVLSRLVLNQPIVGAVELAQIMMICIFPIAVSGAYEKRHIKVDVVADMLPQKVQKATDKIVIVATAIFSILIAWHTYQASIFSRDFHITYSLLKISEYPFLILFALSFMCIAIVSVASLFCKNEAEEE